MTVPYLDARASAVSKASKYKTRVYTKCSGQFSFRIQKLVKVKAASIPGEPKMTALKSDWRKLSKKYRTTGKTKSRTVNLPKGTYRSVVTGRCGYQTTTTNSATLKK